MIQRDIQLNRYEKLNSELYRLLEEIENEETPIVIESLFWRERTEKSIRDLRDTLETMICALERAAQEGER